MPVPGGNGQLSPKIDSPPPQPHNNGNHHASKSSEEGKGGTNIKLENTNSPPPQPQNNGQNHPSHHPSQLGFGNLYIQSNIFLSKS